MQLRHNSAALLISPVPMETLPWPGNGHDGALHLMLSFSFDMQLCVKTLPCMASDACMFMDRSQTEGAWLAKQRLHLKANH